MISKDSETLENNLVGLKVHVCVEGVGGKIMKMGNTFACFMTKKTVFSQVIQLPTYKSIFFI